MKYVFGSVATYVFVLILDVGAIIEPLTAIATVLENPH